MAARAKTSAISSRYKIFVGNQARKQRVVNDMAIRRALEAGGVEFIDENGTKPLVRLVSRKQRCD